MYGFFIRLSRQHAALLQYWHLPSILISSWLKHPSAKINRRIPILSHNYLKLQYIKHLIFNIINNNKYSQSRPFFPKALNREQTSRRQSRPYSKKKPAAQLFAFSKQSAADDRKPSDRVHSASPSKKKIKKSKTGQRLHTPVSTSHKPPWKPESPIRTCTRVYAAFSSSLFLRTILYNRQCRANLRLRKSCRRKRNFSFGLPDTRAGTFRQALLALR